MGNINNSAVAEMDSQKVITDFNPAVSKSYIAPNKKLSESRLKLAAIAALPTNVETEITLKEALKGTTRSFVVKDQTVCSSCINAKPINRLHCADCKGLGYNLSERQVEITIEAGITADQEIRYVGLGANDIRSNKNGDLVVKVKLSEHSFFKTEGKNITCNLKVSLYEATLGGKIEVPTINGKVVMTLEPLTRPGSVYRLKGLGIAGGDQLLTIEVSMPQKLTPEQVLLFQKIKEIADKFSTETNLAFVS